MQRALHWAGHLHYFTAIDSIISQRRLSITMNSNMRCLSTRVGSATFARKHTTTIHASTSRPSFWDSGSTCGTSSPDTFKLKPTVGFHTGVSNKVLCLIGQWKTRLIRHTAFGRPLDRRKVHPAITRRLDSILGSVIHDWREGFNSVRCVLSDSERWIRYKD